MFVLNKCSYLSAIFISAEQNRQDFQDEYENKA